MPKMIVPLIGTGRTNVPAIRGVLVVTMCGAVMAAATLVASATAAPLDENCTPPPNEDCDGAYVFGSADLPYVVQHPLGCVNDEIDKPYFDVFYRYECTVTGDHVVGMCDSPGDTYLRIYADGCGWSDGWEYAVDDDGCPGSPPNADPLLVVTLHAGTTYYFELGTWRDVPPWAPPLNSIFNFTVALADAPFITSQPVSQTACLGQEATFSVTADGAEPMYYQWRKDGADLPEATSADFIIEEATLDDIGTYTVVVSNAIASVTSAPADLLVREAPLIVTQPLSQDACLGESATFTIEAQGAEPLTYQWRLNGIDLAGADDDTYVISLVSEQDYGDYDVVVTDSCGEATSAVASLTVDLCPPPGVRFTITKVAVSGDEPPEAPGESFTSFAAANPSISAAGEVAFKGNFDGSASGNEGIYKFDGGGLHRIVDDSFDFTPPGQSGATSWTSFGPAVISNSGDVLFHGNFSFGDNSQGLYIDRGAEVELIFDDNPLQPVPGQPTAIGFTTFPFRAGVLPLLNDAMQGVTIADFRDATYVDREGIYLGDPDNGIVRVADQTMTPPGQPPGAQFSTLDIFMALNNFGDAAFQAAYTGGIGNNGIYRFNGDTGELLCVADGDTVPPDQPDNARFSSLENFHDLNDTGQAVFRATYTAGLGSKGIFRGDGSGPLETVVDNSGAYPVPDHPGRNYFEFGNPVMNAAGDVVFVGEFGPFAHEIGLYIKSGETIAKVVDFADPVPGQPGAYFFALGSYVVNAQGHVTFAARYGGGIGNEGIYFFDGQQLVRVIDEADALLGKQIDNFHMMLGIGGSGGQDGKPKTMNDLDQIAFRVTFDDGDEGIFLAVPAITAGDAAGTVLIDDAGNAPNIDGRGSLDRLYRIGTFEVTNTEYVDFLNAVAVNDPHGLYDEVMTTSLRGGIERLGAPGSFSYFVKPNFGNKPANGFSWTDAARYCNWLHNGRPSGWQGPTTTEDGAYDLSRPLDRIRRQPGARWFLPTQDEWYKAAYYDPFHPAADDGGTPDYWRYPTRADTMPEPALADEFGDVINPGPNVAAYGRHADWNGTCEPPHQDTCGNLVTVGGAGSEGPWGTFDMGGNIYEWTETPGLTISGDPPMPTRQIRGGDFANQGELMLYNRDPDLSMQADAANIGMRVCAAIGDRTGTGDHDLDGDRDLDDFAAFQRCFTGADVFPYSAGCAVFDIDADRDVDLSDFDVFEWAVSGPTAYTP